MKHIIFTLLLFLSFISKSQTSLNDSLYFSLGFKSISQSQIQELNDLLGTNETIKPLLFCENYNAILIKITNTASFNKILIINDIKKKINISPLEKEISLSTFLKDCTNSEKYNNPETKPLLGR